MVTQWTVRMAFIQDLGKVFRKADNGDLVWQGLLDCSPVYAIRGWSDSCDCNPDEIFCSNVSVFRDREELLRIAGLCATDILETPPEGLKAFVREKNGWKTLEDSITHVPADCTSECTCSDWICNALNQTFSGLTAGEASAMAQQILLQKACRDDFCIDYLWAASGCDDVEFGCSQGVLRASGDEALRIPADQVQGLGFDAGFLAMEKEVLRAEELDMDLSNFEVMNSVSVQIAFGVITGAAKELWYLETD